MCHPIGYGFERLDSKIGYMYRISLIITGGDSSFFFREDGERGWAPEGDYLWEAITLNISLKGGRG